MAINGNKSLIDTIVAQSSGRGAAGVSLIRVSGPNAFEIFSAISPQPMPEARRASIRELMSSSGRVIDEALVAVFKGPNSFTGEDVIEIGCHGNPVIVEEIISEFVSRGTRRAEPGEFTKRAVQNGRISLEQAEALDWVINGKTPQAVNKGLLAKRSQIGMHIEPIREKMLNTRASIEALLDFEEHEVPDQIKNDLVTQVESLVAELRAWVKAYETSKRWLRAWNVVLIGEPNSGKSSLFNRIIGQEKAIVFDRPGTTRDSLEHFITESGLDLCLVDTAGLRDSLDPIERLGIERSMGSIDSADLVCWLSASGQDLPAAIEKRLGGKPVVRVLSKADLFDGEIGGFLRVSSQTGEGLEELRSKIFPAPDHSALDCSPLTSDRQLKVISECIQHLSKAYSYIELSDDIELAADQMAQAANILSELVGQIPTDEVLKEVLSRFCIGK